MNKDELIALSDSTFIDNDTGEIQPAGHRAFNEQLIGSVPELVPYIGENLASPSWYNPLYPQKATYIIQDDDIGQTFTVTMLVKAVSASQIYVINNQWTGGGWGTLSYLIDNINTEWKTISKTFVIPEGVRGEQRNMWFVTYPAVNIELKWLKIEKSNNKTPYIPAAKDIAVNIDDTSLSEQAVPNKLFLDPQSGQAKQLYRKTYKFSKQINSGSFSSILEQTLPLTYRIVNVNGCAYRRADGGVFPIPYYWNGTDDYIGNISVYSRKNTNNMVLLCVGNGIRSFSDNNIDVVITIEYIKD